MSNSVSIPVEQPLFDDLKTAAEQWLETQPVAPAALDRKWVGSLENCQAFPQYARTMDPQIIDLFHAHLEGLMKWERWAMGLLTEATGNPDLAVFYNSGRLLEQRALSGVAYSAVASSHEKWWKRANSQGIRSWAVKHPLAAALDNARYVAPSLGGLPPTVFTENYLVSPRVFFEGDALWCGFSYKPCDKSYDVELSPWEPVKRWEYYKALDEHEEANNG